VWLVWDIRENIEVLVRKHEANSYLEDLGVDGMIIL
jgi:hypothetical protein